MASRVLFGESGDVAQLGPAERVDRLIGIAGDSEVPVRGREKPGHLGLCRRGVLVLVDDDVAEPGGELEAGRGPQELYRRHQERAVVGPPQLLQCLSIPGKEPGDSLPIGALGGSLGECLGGQEPLRAPGEEIGDLGREGTGGQDPAVGDRPCSRVFGGEQACDHSNLFWWGERDRPHPGACLEQPQGQGVKRRGVDWSSRPPDGLGDPALDVGRRTAGERQE